VVDSEAQKSQAREDRQADCNRIRQRECIRGSGLPEPAERLAKAELARVIRKLVSDKQWTQSQAAKALGIAPPDMSDLIRGKLARFSQERLERFLNALDMDVHIQVGPRRTGKKRATVTVELVGAF
jgi:predicted XRE-type DNA-binding protein